MKTPRFILASQSPQRKRILSELGVTFKVHPAHIDEHHAGYKKPHAIAKSIALRKAESVAKHYPNHWVIGCDTIVILKNGEIALKPSGPEEARTVIKLYQGSSCSVYSGLALVNLSQNVMHCQTEKTVIHFKNFSDQELNTYLESGNWKDRSGSLTIEERMEWIKQVEGDYWNVVGLPVNLFKKMLKAADLI